MKEGVKMRVKDKDGTSRRYVFSVMILAWAIFAVLQAAHAESEGVPLDKGSEKRLLNFKYNSDAVGLQGKICTAQYKQGEDVITIEFFYWGYDQGRLNMKRVIKTPDKKGNIQRREDILVQDPNAERVCSLEPVPGRRLMLELDNFNQLLVSEAPMAPREGLEGY